MEPPVVAALVGAVAALLLGVYNIAVQPRLKSHDARLRISVEWRLRLLEEMLQTGGTLRTRINAAFGAIHKISQETSLRGETEKGVTLLEECEQAIRDVATPGGFLTPDLVERSRFFVRTFEDILGHIITMSKLKTVPERQIACEKINSEVEVLGPMVTQTFDCWYGSMWERQERALFSPTVPEFTPAKMEGSSGVSRLRE